MTHTGFQEFRTNFYELIHRGGISENLKEEFLVHDGDGKGGILNHLDLIFLDPNRGSKARDAYSLLRVTHTEFQEFRTNFYELIHHGGMSENLKEEFYKKLPQEFQSHLFGDYRDKGVTLAQLADAAAEHEPVSSWTRARAKTENGRAPGTKENSWGSFL
ncbi:hypothetical protein E4U51_000079 [Claviceps purpurea]|nr:hypothetical protein E4U51_000079 [Claviceps purpurea]